MLTFINTVKPKAIHESFTLLHHNNFLKIFPLVFLQFFQTLKELAIKISSSAELQPTEFSMCWGIGSPNTHRSVSARHCVCTVYTQYMVICFCCCDQVCGLIKACVWSIALPLACKQRHTTSHWVCLQCEVACFSPPSLSPPTYSSLPKEPVSPLMNCISQ